MHTDAARLKFTNFFQLLKHNSPVVIVLSLCFFIVAGFGNAISDAASAPLGLIFLVSLFYAGKYLWHKVTIKRFEQLTIIFFALFFLAGLVGYINSNDSYEFVKVMGRYLRFLLIIPVFYFLVRYRAEAYRSLMVGVLISGPVSLFMAISNVDPSNPAMPASSEYHWIFFGDITVLNAMLLMASLFFTDKNNVQKFLYVLSIGCLLYAAVLIQARGAWVAIPLLFLIVLFHLFKKKTISLKHVVIGFVMLLVAIVIVPHKQVVVNRVSLAFDDVKQFVDGTNYNTSVGARLALWHVAYEVWKEHPVIGTGVGDFNDDLAARQKQGMYPAIKVHGSTHNIYFQSLAETGTLGLLVMICALIVVPWYYFSRACVDDHIKISGQVFVLAFAVFGLTESWYLRAPFVAVYLTYFVALANAVSFSGQGRDI